MKRLSNEAMWKKNITKRLKNEGKEYTSSRSQKVVAEKKWDLYEVTSADLSAQNY